MGLNEDFEQMAMVHLAAVYRAAVAVCGNKDVADDIAQTTLLKAYERFSSFKKGTNCKAWLLSILRNTWIDYLRKQQRKPDQRPLDEDLPAKNRREETVWSNPDDLLENFSDEQVIRALHQLPEGQRLTLYLVDVEQLNHDEAAAIMNVAVGTIKSRASRARSALKLSLTAYAKDMNMIGGDL
jgi:RNA polymerase sigma-70 factor (ECF subfamily)